MRAKKSKMVAVMNVMNCLSICAKLTKNVKNRGISKISNFIFERDPNAVPKACKS